MNAWKNESGKPIPEWLQGRGTGEAGKILHVFDDTGKLRRVEPGETVRRKEIENAT